MTYIKPQSKLINTSFVSQPSTQTILSNYTEITGSKVEINYSYNPKLLYRFSFMLSTIYQFGSIGTYYKPWLHVKLQKSNDDFVSNVVDIPGCQMNVSGDTIENRDYFYSAYSMFFILENFDSSYLRLVTRSYSDNNRAKLHRTGQFDGNSTNEIYFNPSLLVLEI